MKIRGVGHKYSALNLWGNQYKKNTGYAKKKYQIFDKNSRMTIGESGNKFRQLFADKAANCDSHSAQTNATKNII